MVQKEYNPQIFKQTTTGKIYNRNTFLFIAHKIILENSQSNLKQIGNCSTKLVYFPRLTMLLCVIQKIKLLIVSHVFIKSEIVSSYLFKNECLKMNLLPVYLNCIDNHLRKKIRPHVISLFSVNLIFSNSAVKNLQN